MLDHMAVLKGIADPKARRAEVERLLDQVNLYGVRKKALAGFSGGMRQRFGIAQALIGGPRLIIVDEPTAGLDPEERNRFLNLLAEIGENVVVLLSTHIVEDVSDLCQAMAIIAGGHIVRQGAPTALMTELDGRIWTKTVDKADIAPSARALRPHLHPAAGRAHRGACTEPRRPWRRLRPSPRRAGGRLLRQPARLAPERAPGRRDAPRGLSRCSCPSRASNSATS